MQYLLLIYANEQAQSQMSPEAGQQLFSDYMAFTQSVKDSGHYRGGEALTPTNTATTVRVRDGKTLTTDGPFAETREQLGGFYLIEASDLDDAIKIAARIPDAKNGSVEVRPIMKFE
jgi:hypothetical protein